MILRCFIVRIWIWFRIDSNNALHKFLEIDNSYNRKLPMACGLVSSIPDRRTFDRRLKTISTDIRQRIAAVMGKLFAAEKLVDPSYIVTAGTAQHY